MGITGECRGMVTGKVGSLGSKGPVINYGEWGGGGQVLPLQKERRGGGVGGGGESIVKVLEIK